MARRVNTKFLVIFSVIVLGGVASAFVAKGPIGNLIRGDRSKKWIAEGDKIMAELKTSPNLEPLERKTRLEDAFKLYSQAAGSETRSPELYVKLGDVCSQLATFDIQFVQASFGNWNKALEIDPRNLPALHRIEENYYKQSASPGAAAAVYSTLQDRASTIYQVDPKDLRAHAIMYIAPIRASLAGIETPVTQLETATNELATLIADNPTSPEIPDMVFYMAMSKIKKGIDQKHLNQEKEGNVLIYEAMKAFQDAIKNNEKSAALHYKYCQALATLQRDDREQDVAQQYTLNLKKELDKARQLVTQDDELFVEIYIASQQVASSEKLPKVAEAILLELYRVKPDDQRVRLALAKMWGADRDKPQNHDLAIELLEKPMVYSGFEGVQAYMKMDLELRSWAELCNLYIARYASLAADKKPTELKRIEDTYEKLYDKAHERADVLKIRGRIELLRGGPTASVEAMKTFEKAQERYKAADKEGREDLELTWELAKVYLRNGQPGSARTELLKLKDRIPGFFLARQMLAQVLIREGDSKAARAEVEFLKENAPDDPEVNRLYLAVLDSVKDAAQVKETFKKLPETNRNEQMFKAQVASYSPVSNPAEAERLFKLVLAAEPTDFDALQGAKDALLAQDKKPEALKLLEDAQKQKPDDEKIGLIIEQLSGASKAEIIEKSERLIRKQLADDPFALELKLYEFNLISRTKKDAFPHLEAAYKLKPEEVRVLDLMFQYYMGERNWDKSAEFADKLGAKNADQAKGLVYRFRLAMAKNDVPGALAIAQDLTAQYREFSRSYLYLGQAQQAARNWSGAIDAYNLALEKQSDNAEALAGNIVCCFQMGKPTEALRYINRGRAAHPSSPYFKNQWTQYQLSQYGDASLVVQPALEDRDANPKDPNRWIALGRAQYSAGQKRDNPKSAKFIADAKATFNEALKQWPKQMVIWAFLSEIADFENDTAGGEAILKRMVASPDFQETPEAYLMLADHYARQSQRTEISPADRQAGVDKCEATMKEALEHFKNFKDQKPATEVRRRLAAYYTQNKKWDEALKLLDPASPDQMVRQQIVEIYMQQAAATKNDPELFGKAEKLVRSMLATSPNEAQLHALLGVVQLNLNQPQRAEESLNNALKLDPKNQAALYSRAQLRMKEQPPRLDAAIVDLKTLRDVNPNHIEGRVTLADAYRQQHLYEDASHELEYALVRAPYRRDIRVNLAGLYAGIKPPDWNDAERIVTDAERIEPKEVLWKRMLGKLWSARAVQEKSAPLHEKATAKIREALALAPTSGEVLSDYLSILESAKNWRQLLAETDQVFKTVPKAAETGWGFYVQHAVALSNLGEPTKSMADFEKALQIVEADKSLGQDVVIQVIDRLQETRGAEATIDRVKALLARSTGAAATRWKVVLARLYFLNKDYPNAIDVVEQARKESAGLDVNLQVSALNVAGAIYMMSGDFAMARTAFEQLLAKRDNDLGALNNLAFIVAEHTQPPDLAKAMEYGQRAYGVMTKNNVSDPNVLDTVGWINVLSGGPKLDEGIRLLKESIDAGEIAEAQYHYGEALLRKNLPEFAKTNLARASELVNAKSPVDEVLKKKVEDAQLRVDRILGPGAAKP